MRRFAVAGSVFLALLLVMSVDLINVDRNADRSALNQASNFQPQAHWSVVRRSFEPWAGNITRGQARYTGGSGPAWVIELSAPVDSRWKSYDAMVVINAITGAANVSVLASN